MEEAPLDGIQSAVGVLTYFIYACVGIAIVASFIISLINGDGDEDNQ